MRYTKGAGILRRCLLVIVLVTQLALCACAAANADENVIHVAYKPTHTAAPQPAPAPLQTPAVQTLAQQKATPAPNGQTILLYDAQTGLTQSADLEEYILHVVAGEMPALYPEEALKAQAVAARSYTLWKSRAYGGGGCSRAADADVCTDSGHCMAYLSEEAMRERWGTAYQTYRARILDAVQATSGEICVYDGEPIQALFHASAAGRTEDADAVFANAVPYLVSVDSADASAEAETLVFRKEKLAKTLNAAIEGANVTAQKLHAQLTVLERTPSGRVGHVRVGDKTVAGTKLRQILELPSTVFTIAFTKDTVSFAVNGAGHGVGLSQTGARAMAEEGATYREILSHFYSDVEFLTLP